MQLRLGFAHCALGLCLVACSEPVSEAMGTTSGADTSSDASSGTSIASTHAEASSDAPTDDDSGSSTTSSSDDASPVTADATSSESGVVETGDETGNETGDDTGNDTEDPSGEFPAAPAFGTNVLDLDLVGTWGLSWDGQNAWTSVLDIDDTGEFVWTETSSDCSSTTFASGHLWVEGMQVVMHVEAWERPLPWDTESVLGESFPPPFRLRMSFTLQGGGADAYLALSAPSRLTAIGPYEGASYVRLAKTGEYLGGTWRGESELHAIPSGARAPVVIVRDTAEALLAQESDPDGPQGTGERAVTTTYFPMPHGEVVYDGANWTCLGGCPEPSGTTLVDGGNLYTYGPYGGYEHLMTFTDGRAFRRDAGTSCP